MLDCAHYPYVMQIVNIHKQAELTKTMESVHCWNSKLFEYIEIGDGRPINGVFHKVATILILINIIIILSYHINTKCNHFSFKHSPPVNFEIANWSYLMAFRIV